MVTTTSVRALGTSLHVGDPRPVIPGPGLPTEAVVLSANNNLDACRFDGRLYLAWRTAPTHFASKRARIQILRSADGGSTWALDGTVLARRDVREPRLVAWGDRLLCYWFTAGTSARRFEPDRIWVTERLGDGRWREPEAISPPDCVVWRVRPLDGRLAMTVYRGAGSLFTAHPVPLAVELWGSDDGWSWTPWDPAHPVVHHGGSEAEFLPLPDGRLVGVVRKEGPESGWGSDVFTAPAGDPTHWTVRHDPRKFDSPWLFLDEGRPLLVARRQPVADGRFDLVSYLEGDERELGIDPVLRTRLDQVLGWCTPKRTMVAEVDPGSRTVHRLGDLPSTGDTAFAATVPLGPGHHLVFNYSSPLGRPRLPWLAGQLGPTAIHAVEIRLHR